MKRAVLLLTVTLLLFGAGAHANDWAKNNVVTLPPDLTFLLMDLEKAVPLFKEDLSNAECEPGGWTFANGELTANGKGDIWTKERYGNFLLALEFKCEKDTNSGVFIRCGDIKNWLHTAIEAQILQNNQDYENPKHHCGAIFDCLEPYSLKVKEPGEWNEYLVIARDNFLFVMLNGTQVVGMDLDQWTEAGKNPDGTPNKFKTAYKDMPREGHIGFQYHGHPIAFRNIRLLKIK